MHTGRPHSSVHASLLTNKTTISLTRSDHLQNAVHQAHLHLLRLVLEVRVAPQPSVPPTESVGS